MKKRVNIIEVGPRDGFQNVKEFIPTHIKLKIIDGLVEAGIKYIQATSFVNPKAVPQMQDSKEVITACIEKYPNVNFFALVPNMYGAKAAVECGVKEISFVISVSESHNMANVKRTCDESFAELEKIRETFPYIKINLDAATAFGCPFEGEIPYHKLNAHIKRGVDLGINSFTICDTIGVANPEIVKEFLNNLIAEYPNADFRVHFHDTRNNGILNTYTAIQSDIKGVEVSIGGLGGCPFAPGASGNTSTEDLVYLLNMMGYNTGVDFDKLLKTANYLKDNVDGNYSGHQIFINKDSYRCQ